MKRSMRRNNDRQAVRQEVGRPARVDYGDGRSVRCVLTDLSPTGARLRLPHCEWMPKTFAVTDVFSGETRQARVAWTGSKHLGIRFLDAPTKAARGGFGRRD